MRRRLGCRALCHLLGHWLGLFLGLFLCLGAPAALAQGRAGAETEADKVVSEADAAFEAGNYEAAAPLYDRALLLDPTRTAVLVKRATLHFRERRYDKAIELLGRAERLSPDDLNVKAVLGLCLYQSQQKERGLRYLTEVTARRAEAYEAQFQIGQHFARLDPQRAIAAFSAYFAHRPEKDSLDALARLHLGTAYFLRGQLPEAEDNLTRALAERQRDPQVQLMLGAVLLARGNYARAAQLHEPFLKDVQRRPAVAYNLAQSYLRLGRRTEAERLSAQYVSLRPADPRGHVLQGDVALFSPKDPDPRAAIRHYEEAERLAGKDGGGPGPAVNIEARKARARFLLRDPDGAIALAELALAGLRREGGADRDRDRDHDEAELLALVIEAELSKVQAGAPPSPQLPELGARLAQLLPRDAHALSLAGSAHLAGGDAEGLGKARRLYGEALAVDSRLPRARAGLARALGRQALALLQEEREGATQEAVALLEQALPYDETVNTRRNLAVAYLIQGRPAEAQRVLAPQQREPGPEMGRLWARTLLMLGKTGPALEAYERALAAGPGAGGGLGAGSIDQADLRIELGARYLALKRWDEAVTTLEQAQRELTGVALTDPEGAEARALAASRRVAVRNLSLSYLLRGRARLREQEALLRQNPQAPTKLAEQALEDLLKAVERGGLQPGRRETGTALCAAALAAVQSARYQQGRDLCAKAQAEGGCELLPPYDRLGVDLLLAYISYRDTGNPIQREKALKVLARLQGKVGTGSSVQPLNDLLKALQRSAHEMLAFDYFLANKVPRAAQLLKAAGRIAGAGEADTAVLLHNLAVIDLQEGRAAGERALERLAGRPPEALVNLGILRDRRGEPKKALDLYRQALQRGAKTPKLRDWIDVKDRLFGEGP